MNLRVALAGLCVTLSLGAQPAEVELPSISVYSPRVANQAPVATFAMPVSALRFEPRVDVQSRNFAEGQADVSVRGGIFENTGFSVGAVSLFDPQTGHYFAEIPIAPGMLGAPRITTGAELALESTNATAGAVAYAWRPIRDAGAASLGGGQFGLTQAEFYQGYTSDHTLFGGRLAADVAWAHSDADGSIRYGDHVFDRVNARVQLATRDTQTDFFAGYQAKFFGWPNLYTPFNYNETEDLQTLLLAVNHRRNFGGADFVEMGAFYRRNKDDYAFDRFAPVGPVHPFQHTTWVRGAAASARRTVGDIAWNARAEIIADALESTSLTFGPYRHRVLTKIGVVPEKSWALADGAEITVKAGATYDDSDRDDAAVSPVFELARTSSASALQRIYVSYSEATQVPTYTALKSSPTSGLFRGNPNLGRETSRNLEAGVQGAVGGWTGQAAVFYRQDDALVDWTFARGVTARSANAVDIATSGVEFVLRRSWRACDLVFGYTWLGKDANYRGAAVDASFYALNFARHRFTAAITARLTPEIEVRMDNELRAQAPNLLRTVGGDEAFISSIGVTYRPARLRRWSFSLQADNLWNSGFQEVPAVPASRRQISGMAGYAW
jgi:outer membrane receptor protein involved in Fe transport